MMNTATSQMIINKIMGNIPTVCGKTVSGKTTSVFTQCIRKRKTSYSQQLIDIDSDYDFDDEEIIYDSRKDGSLKKKYRMHP